MLALFSTAFSRKLLFIIDKHASWRGKTHVIIPYRIYITIYDMKSPRYEILCIFCVMAPISSFFIISYNIPKEMNIEHFMNLTFCDILGSLNFLFYNLLYIEQNLYYLLNV